MGKTRCYRTFKQILHASQHCALKSVPLNNVIAFHRFICENLQKIYLVYKHYIRAGETAIYDRSEKQSLDIRSVIGLLLKDEGRIIMQDNWQGCERMRSRLKRNSEGLMLAII